MCCSWGSFHSLKPDFVCSLAPWQQEFAQEEGDSCRLAQAKLSPASPYQPAQIHRGHSSPRAPSWPCSEPAAIEMCLKGVVPKFILCVFTSPVQTCLAPAQVGREGRLSPGQNWTYCYVKKSQKLFWIHLPAQGAEWDRVRQRWGVRTSGGSFSFSLCFKACTNLPRKILSCLPNPVNVSHPRSPSFASSLQHG